MSGDPALEFERRHQPQLAARHHLDERLYASLEGVDVSSVLELHGTDSVAVVTWCKGFTDPHPTSARVRPPPAVVGAVVARCRSRTAPGQGMHLRSARRRTARAVLSPHTPARRRRSP